MMPKFRAWGKYGNQSGKFEMFYDVSVVTTYNDKEQHVIAYFGMYNESEYSVTEIIDYRLMQSTGLFDKNGQEIFEGDVVICYDEQDEYGPYPCQIFFCEDNLAWSLKELPTEDKYTMSEYGWDEIEVIGNIYENPELVEAENEQN